MKTLENLYTFIRNLDEKEFLKYTYIILGLILLFSGIIAYTYFSKRSSLKKELKKISIARQEAQSILSKDIQVKKQKEHVDEIIKKSKNFKLIQYFDSIIEKIGISGNLKNREVTTSDLENLRTEEKNEYTEVKLNVSLTDINMKQLVELLDEFEKNERIYTKSLEITKSTNTPNIDVNVVIATIQPVAEVAEITE